MTEEVAFKARARQSGPRRRCVPPTYDSGCRGCHYPSATLHRRGSPLPRSTGRPSFSERRAIPRSSPATPGPARVTKERRVAPHAYASRRRRTGHRHRDGSAYGPRKRHTHVPGDDGNRPAKQAAIRWTDPPERTGVFSCGRASPYPAHRRRPGADLARERRAHDGPTRAQKGAAEGCRAGHGVPGE